MDLQLNYKSDTESEHETDNETDIETDLETDIEDEEDDDINEDEDEDEQFDDNYDDNYDDELDYEEKEEIKNDDSDDEDDDDDDTEVELKVVANEDRATKPFLTNNEFINILITRTGQLQQGAKPMIIIESNQKISEKDIALLELKNKVNLIKVKRELPNGNIELWNIDEFLNIDELILNF